MMKMKAASKGAKLEKPRPLRTIHRTLSEPAKNVTDTAGVDTLVVVDTLAGGDTNTAGDCTSRDIIHLDRLVTQMEQDSLRLSVDKILDLCQLLHDKGKVLEKICPDAMQRCFSAVRLATKEGSISAELRLLLLDLVELRANNWESENQQPPQVVSPRTFLRQNSLPTPAPVISKLKEDPNASDTSIETIELNTSFQKPVEIKWNAAGHMWQCEIVLPSDKVERVRAKTKYRAQVLDILKTSKMIISKDEVWNHRQIALLGKKHEIRKAAKVILEVVALKEPNISMLEKGEQISQSSGFCLEDLSTSDISDLSMNRKNLSHSKLLTNHYCTTNSVLSKCSEPSCQSRNSFTNSIRITETADEEIQTEPLEHKRCRSNSRPVTPTKWEQQSLLQFTQGTLCLCASSTDKAVLAEAKDVLRQHFSNLRQTHSPPHEPQSTSDGHMKRSKSAEGQSILLRDDKNLYASMCRSKSDVGTYMRSLSTPEKTTDSLQVPGHCYNNSRRLDKGDDSVFGNKSDSLLDENQFTRELMDQLKLPEEHGARVSSSTPDGTPDASLAVSPVSDCSGKDRYCGLADDAPADKPLVPVTLSPSQIRSIVDGVVSALTGSKVPAFLNRVEKHEKGETLKSRVQTLRQPIIAATPQNEVDEVEGNMPGGLYTPKGRRAMFKRYSEQVLKAQGGFVNNISQPESLTKVYYSWEELLSCANSKQAKRVPSDWSCLSKIYPEVCLLEVERFFDPVSYAKQISEDRARYPLGKIVFRTPRPEFPQKSYIVDEQLDHSLNTVEETVRDQ